MRRLLVVLGIAASMATLIAGPVSARAEQERVPSTTTFQFEGNNPCNGAGIVYDGEGKGFTQVVTTPSGETLTKLHVVSSGEAVDQLGNTYTWHSASNEEYLGDVGPVNSTLAFKVISVGSADNFVTNLQFHIDPNGEDHTNFAGSECRG